MYESPVILAIGNNDPDSCGTPAIFGNCDVYCSGTNAYCVMITVYNQFCVLWVLWFYMPRNMDLNDMPFK